MFVWSCRDSVSSWLKPTVPTHSCQRYWNISSKHKFITSYQDFDRLYFSDTYLNQNCVHLFPKLIMFLLWLIWLIWLSSMFILCLKSYLSPLGSPSTDQRVPFSVGPGGSREALGDPTGWVRRAFWGTWCRPLLDLNPSTPKRPPSPICNHWLPLHSRSAGQ